MIAIDTGVPVPTMNGVLVHGADADPGAIAGLVAELQARGANFGVQVRPMLVDAMAPALADAGLVKVDEIPFMVLDSLDSLIRPHVAPGVEIHAVGRTSRATLDDAITVGATGFEVPAEVYAAATGLTMNLPGATCLVGYVDDAPVTTEVIIPSTHDSFGLFNLATPSAYRGRGYGATMMNASIDYGFATGASWGWLQASSDGFPIYERLGFEVVERWPFYCPTNVPS